MEQNLENKLDLRNRLINFFKINKSKLLVFLIISALILISVVFFKVNNEKKNILIAEKYVRAGIFLASEKNVEAKLLYEEIILSNNKFYSILALNALIEKNLETDKEIILNYFNILEKTISTKENNDLINFKKALFLIKSSNLKEGNELLKDLISKDSGLKSIAKEILEE